MASIPVPFADVFRESEANIAAILAKPVAHKIVLKICVVCVLEDAHDCGGPLIPCNWYAYITLADRSYVRIAMQKQGSGRPGEVVPGILSFVEHRPEQPEYVYQSQFYYESTLVGNAHMQAGFTFRNVLEFLKDEGMVHFTFLVDPVTHPAHWYFWLLSRLAVAQHVGGGSARGLLMKVDEENASLVRLWRADYGTEGDIPPRQYDAAIAERYGRFTK